MVRGPHRTFTSSVFVDHSGEMESFQFPFFQACMDPSSDGVFATTSVVFSDLEQDVSQSDKWQEIDHCVKLALALDFEDQKQYLQKLASEKPDLHGEVIWFLGAETGLSGFMEEPLMEHMPTLMEHSNPVTRFQTQNGQYKILDCLGEGGMGRVYLVQDTGHLKRKVALKVISKANQCAVTKARFENESRIMAKLNHPFIAQIYEHGLIDQEQPYFTMEYVNGHALNDFCQKYQLTIKEKLQLFMDICSAVAYAHKKGVVHRDLKPNNVMVTFQKNQIIPKVVDFGIASSFFSDIDSEYLHQKKGQVIGTPAFMSPEQLDLNPGNELDERSDVFSLGHLFFEILTGGSAYDSKSFKSLSLISSIEKLKLSNVKPPSQKVLDRPEQEHLASILRGDLDDIVLKALRSDCRQRYQTVAELMADLQAYLSQKPIQEGRTRFWYCLGKFFLRHRCELKRHMVTCLLTILIYRCLHWVCSL